MYQRKDIDHAIQALIDHDPNNGIVNVLPAQGAQLATHDVYNLTLPYLSKKAQSVLSVKAHYIHHERNAVVPGKEAVFNSILFIQVLYKLGLVNDPLIVNNFHTGSYTRELDIVHYVGFRLKLRDINIGLVRIAAALNAMAEKDLITACLAKPIMIPLYSPEEAGVVIAAYVAIDNKKIDTFNEHFGTIVFQEGETPRNLSK